jgi:hypothetical protein
VVAREETFDPAELSSAAVLPPPKTAATIAPVARAVSKFASLTPRNGTGGRSAVMRARHSGHAGPLMPALTARM